MSGGRGTSVFHLIALEVLARDDRNRPQDRADLRQLLQTSTPEALEHVRSALTQIRERGFHRNRDLLGALDELLVE
jgi:hypothetical protein